MHSYSSKLLEEAVEEFARLPGIGRKTALRLVLFLLKQEDKEVEHFGQTILRMKKEILTCRECFNISDSEVCHICSDTYRDKQTICVVESIRDVMSIENTQQFNGVYHVLGGIISPMDGIGPADLRITELVSRVRNGSIREVIVATNPTVEGDTTALYVGNLLKETNVNVSRIALGLPVGGDLEYADRLTLSQALKGRIRL